MVGWEEGAPVVVWVCAGLSGQEVGVMAFMGWTLRSKARGHSTDALRGNWQGAAAHSYLPNNCR